ncbi:L-threonylcarbamoyladenylate synthase [Fulvivirgaceae bacterium BMA10]|uniref:Threonylcarbamoyl-AMP synthase n=1 Tax=Splendidivirga corallicola TaxID=3051826 RepID=A0ABT8KRI6_9BACT|nr:L-threonylcarbamoyladenylate synthase [Fulvivirgaceae bacterium BMA10]
MAEIGTDIQRAKELLIQSNLVAIPTETVYGLAGNAFDTEAITEIFSVKNRPFFDPLIVHTDSIEKVKSFTKEIPKDALMLFQQFCPGPLTVLLPRNQKIPDLITSGLPNVAVRIPDHHLTRSLLEVLDFPLAAPSANPFGYISPTSASHVNDQLGEKIPYILDGGSCKVGIESTIVGFENNKAIVHRLGGMDLDLLKKYIKDIQVMEHSSSKPKAPGQLKSHYAPNKPFILGDLTDLIRAYTPEDIAILSFCETHPVIPQENQLILSRTGDLKEAAKNLFSALRKLDTLPVKAILAEEVPSVGLGLAINDRLRRAAAERR